MIVGSVPLVAPQINDDFSAILEWADGIRRLKVRTNADTPEDSAKAREFGAEGIGLCRTEHMFAEAERLQLMREMILAGDEDGRRSALERLLPIQQADFEGIFEAMAGLPVTIRLLDWPLHEFLPALEEEQDERMRERIRSLQESNPMLGWRACRLGLFFPEIYEMQVRAIVRAAIAVRERGGDAPLVEIMHPLVGFGEELKRLRELTVRVAAEEGELDYLVGTMIELPRACIRADEIAEHADFFSFGTNDLTQTALGLSRDDAGRFLSHYLETGILERDPFETIDQDGVGDLMKIAVERGRGVRSDIKLGICGEHGGEPKSVAFCHRLGLDYVSCSPYRVPLARLAAAQAALAEQGTVAVADRRLGVALHLPVRDQERKDADAGNPDIREDVVARVGGVAPPEVRDRQHAQGARCEAAQVAADRDSGHGEREGEIHDEQRDCTASEDIGPLALEHDRGAEDAEDRAGRADGRRKRIGVEEVGPRADHQRSRSSGETGNEIDPEIPEGPERLLDYLSDEPECDHVQREVQRPVVEEARRDQAPPLAFQQAEQLAVGPAVHDDEGALLVDRAAVAGDRGTLGELKQVDADVDRDQRLRHDRRAPGRAPLNVLSDALRRSGTTRVVGAADADGAERHAVGADAAAALGTGDARFAIRVPVAPERLGHPV